MKNSNEKVYRTKISSEKFKQFCDILTDISKIDDKCRIKKENNKLLLYSLTGPDGSVHAFKFFDVDYDQFFETDITSLDLILTDIKKLVKQSGLYV
jgi:hypothetical protein